MKSLHAPNYSPLLYKREDFCPKRQFFFRMEGFQKKMCGVCTYDKWKPKISSIFHFEQVNNDWTSHFLCVKPSYPNTYFRHYSIIQIIVRWQPIMILFSKGMICQQFEFPAFCCGRKSILREPQFVCLLWQLSFDIPNTYR